MRTLLLLASISDKIVEPVVDVATEFIGSAGVAAVFLLMTLESACIPIPSEAIMLFAGFSVSKGELTLVGIVVAGVLGNLAGSWIAYAVGYYGRLDLLEKNRLIHVNPKHLKWADDWFARYGSATVFFSRMLPIIRTFISLPAGVARDAVLALHALHRSPARSPGCWRWRWSAKRSATTGRTGATSSATSTTSCWRRSSVGIVYLIVKRRRGRAGAETAAS